VVPFLLLVAGSNHFLCKQVTKSEKEERTMFDLHFCKKGGCFSGRPPPQKQYSKQMFD
jgi:hypothetical protein